MQAGKGDFADGVEMLEVGFAVEVDGHPAAQVVGRRHHRKRLPGHVEAVFQAGLVDVGETVPDVVRVLVGDVEIDAVVAVGLHFVVDGAGHDVAGRKVLQVVVLLHESGAVAPAQDRPFAPDRFGDEKRLGMGMEQGGRVELHEFHVGDGGAGAVGHGDTVAGGHVGVAGVEIDLAGAAGGEEGDFGGKGLDRSLVDVEHMGAEAAVGLEAASA